ncbi:MAG: hypothetical protein HY721_09860 [Planctomycetes bacterium]|nr:hypothetical protein [Planctomycetota bacterium]
MRSRGLSLAAGLCAAAAALGCGSAEMADATVAPVDIANLASVRGGPTYHDYKKVYSVDVLGSKVSRRHVGFLDRRFTDEDREGKTFVLDRKHDVRGFLLPSGKAFLYDPRAGDASESRDLGNTGLESAVKKILEVPGGIELEAVPSASTAPPEPRDER